MKEQCNPELFKGFCEQFNIVPLNNSENKVFFSKLNDMMLFYLLLKDRFAFDEYDLVYHAIRKELWIRERIKPDYTNQR